MILALALWILLSGFDDLIVDIAAFLASFRNRLRGGPARRDLLRAPEQRIAIFIPCWREHAVIEDMISRNRERVLYRNYAFFVGAYPNDQETISAVCRLSERFDNVHLALCPHDGPTSKADCLNWTWQRMIVYESDRQVRFDLIVTHDAEDVVHPDALHWINWYSRDYEMVQIPVLPLPTPLLFWTHGVYCDEFSEYQQRDMPARQWMDAFIPSNGVGTGFRRSALDALAEAEGNRIFEPVCLTEDYENGLRLKLRGARQIFVGQASATREYFPLTFRNAVRQRTRWVTGIALQTWARHGWKGSLATRYWLWRDRRGLIGNPASFAANLLFAWGLVFRPPMPEELMPFLGATAAVGLYRLLYRVWCVRRNYGWGIAAGVPVRVVLANCINTCATLRALVRYATAVLQTQPLVWVKTEHHYPSSAALQPAHRPFGQVLVAAGYVDADQLQEALRTQPAGRRLGEHLVALGYLSEDDVYEALSLQSELPYTSVTVESVRRDVARALPAQVAREWKVMPFRVEDGKLLLASTDVPATQAAEELSRFTRLEIRFHLVQPAEFEELVEAFS